MEMANSKSLYDVHQGFQAFGDLLPFQVDALIGCSYLDIMLQMYQGKDGMIEATWFLYHASQEAKGCTYI